MSFQRARYDNRPGPLGSGTAEPPSAVLDVLSDALNTEACAAATTGQDWTELLSGALDIALTARLDEQARPGQREFHATCCGTRRLAASNRAPDNAVARYTAPRSATATV